MRISAKGEYAIKAVLDLAVRGGEALVPIQDIAGRQAIPQRYLEHVLLALKRAGVLGSKRGASGGYHLTRRPEEISVGDVLRAVEGSPAPLEARRRIGRRNGDETYELGELWEEIGKAVSEVVERVTFGDLATRALARRSAVRAMYHI
jgi:Rrf2 family protein